MPQSNILIHAIALPLNIQGGAVCGKAARTVLCGGRLSEKHPYRDAGCYSDLAGARRIAEASMFSMSYNSPLCASVLRATVADRVSDSSVVYE